MAHRVEGVIACLADVAAPLPDLIEQLGDRVVLVDRVPLGWSGRSVSVDNRHGGRLAAEHLTGTGRRRLAVLSGPAGFTHVANRVGGFTAALPAGSTCDVAVAPSFDYASGHAVMTELLCDLRPDGVFCCSDALAIGALSAIARAGRRVTDDVAVVGYDDVAQAAVTVPPLTTVAQPTDAMAERALALLLDPAASPSPPLPPRLIVRESA
jgi:DNA-binding LacI/PurR family transcriptional regulator